MEGTLISAPLSAGEAVLAAVRREIIITQEQLPHGGWRAGREKRDIYKSTAHRTTPLFAQKTAPNLPWCIIPRHRVGRRSLAWRATVNATIQATLPSQAGGAL